MRQSVTSQRVKASWNDHNRTQTLNRCIEIKPGGGGHFFPVLFYYARLQIRSTFSDRDVNKHLGGSFSVKQNKDSDAGWVFFFTFTYTDPWFWTRLTLHSLERKKANLLSFNLSITL